MARPAQKVKSPPPGRTIVRELIQLVDNMEQHLLRIPPRSVGGGEFPGETLNADWVGRIPMGSEKTWDGLMASRDSWDSIIRVSQVQI